MTTLEAFTYYQKTKNLPDFIIDPKTLNKLYKEYIPFKARCYIFMHGEKHSILRLLKDLHTIGGIDALTRCLKKLKLRIEENYRGFKYAVSILDRYSRKSSSTYLRLVSTYDHATYYLLEELSNER